jgi:hypothetical protein
MLRLTHRNVAVLSLFVAAAIFMTGCGVTLSPVKRMALEVVPLKTSLPPDLRVILVRFESTLPGTPLSETVWDNRSGPFPDVKESRQIGFTQDYGIYEKHLFDEQATVEAALDPSYTRIFIPFGRILQGVFESGLQKAFPNSLVCSDDSCELEKLQSAAPPPVVRLKVAEFTVWEEPLNHLNLKAVVEYRVYRAGNTNQPDFIGEARHEVAHQSIGSVMTTSSGFMKKMNQMSNEFAGVLAEEILKNLQQKLGD